MGKRGLVLLEPREVCREFWDRVSNAKLVSSEADAKYYIAHGDVRLNYDSQLQFESLAMVFNIMSDEKALVTIDFSPVNEVPEKAPAPKVDFNNPHLSYDDVLPSAYFSMADLELWLEERDADSRILTVTGCSMEYVYDPEKGIESGDWKP